MLSPYDDLPIHQAGLPVAQPASADPNVYDRYFFCGYDVSVPYYFAAAMGHYPNRDVMDAGFSILVDGVQHSVMASQRIPAERSTTKLGPIEIQVLEPLRTLRYLVDAPQHGIRADLTFRARTPVIQEPRQTLLSGQKVMMDSTRLDQSGTWEGWIELEGNRLDVRPETSFGTRDRSWGLRPIGEPAGGAPPLDPSGIYWLWGPTNFADRATFFGVGEKANGDRTFTSGLATPILAAGAPTYGAEAWGTLRHAHFVDVDVAWQPGTRRSERATVTLRWRDGTSEALQYEPLIAFQMKGIGYTHPDWGHGKYQGESADTGDRWKAADIDPMALEHFHVHQLCKVTSGDQVGAGVFEQIVIGPHAPSGFDDWFDGAK
jgi:hypothetical protein